MKHFASSSFWSAYDALPARIRKTADKNYELLKKDPKHASLNFKQIGRLWSVRTGIRYRALAVVQMVCSGSGLAAMQIMTS